MKQLLTSLLLLLATGISRAQEMNAGRETRGWITIGQRARSFILYVPHGYSPSRKIPLIILLHGGGATAASMFHISNGTDFQTISERDTVLLVAPQGIDKSWNDGRDTKAHRAGVNDVQFVASLLTYLQSRYAIDSSRIYATGISNGGFMASRLGCEMGRRLAAIAVVAATMGVDTPLATCGTHAMPVLYIHGTDDPVVPFDGGVKTIGAEGAFVSHRQVMDDWVRRDGCDRVPVVTELPDQAADGTHITETDYTGGRDGSEVTGYVIRGGGHTWPGGKQYLPRVFIGRVSGNMNGCEVIWEFFRRHALNGSNITQ